MPIPDSRWFESMYDSYVVDSTNLDLQSIYKYSNSTQIISRSPVLQIKLFLAA